MDEKKVSDLIVSSHEELARDIAGLRYGALHVMFDRYGLEPGAIRDYTSYELSCLANAVGEKNPALFTEYIDWMKSMLSARGVPLDILGKNIELMRGALLSFLPAQAHAIISRYLQAGLSEAQGPPETPRSFIDPGSPCADLAQRYQAAGLRGDRAAAVKLLLDGFHNGLAIQDIYLKVLQPVQYEIGLLWQTNKITVAQEHFCSAVTQMVMSQLYYPYICGTEKKRASVMAGVCVSGELHEIGMRMVADFFELDGWQVYYLGIGMPIPDIVDTLLDKKAAILGVSAAMASSVRRAEKIISAVRASRAASVKIMVGGFGFNREPGLWKLVGADGYAGSADQALRLAEKLLRT